MQQTLIERPFRRWSAICIDLIQWVSNHGEQCFQQITFPPFLLELIFTLLALIFMSLELLSTLQIESLRLAPNVYVL